MPLPAAHLPSIYPLPPLPHPASRVPRRPILPRSYGRLLDDSAMLGRHLLALCGTDDLAGRRVGFLAPPNYDYVVMQWAAWRAGGIAVPMSTHAAASELAYAIEVGRQPVALLRDGCNPRQGLTTLICSWFMLGLYVSLKPGSALV